MTKLYRNCTACKQINKICKKKATSIPLNFSYFKNFWLSFNSMKFQIDFIKIQKYIGITDQKSYVRSRKSFPFLALNHTV